MAFDVANHRLFLGCDNKLMVMMDSTNGKVVYSVPIGEGVDSTWFDPQTKLAFTSNGGAGTVTVAHEDSPSVLKIVQTIKTRPRRPDDGARSGRRIRSIWPRPTTSRRRPDRRIARRRSPAPFRVLTYQMK